MSSFRLTFVKGFVWGVVLTYLFVGFAPVAYESWYVAKKCEVREITRANEFTGHYVFERLSLFFWRANCVATKPKLVISASEGTGNYKFSQAFFDKTGEPFWELRGAHRGLKTLAYLLSTGKIKNTAGQPIVTLVNPVYFSFGAQTDDAAMKRTALSPLSFLWRLPHWKYKSQTLFFSFPFVSAKEFLSEWELLGDPKPKSKPMKKRTLPQKPMDKDYDFDHNMLKAKVSTYRWALKRDKFHGNMPPVEAMLEKTLANIEKKNLPVCLVLLPLNEKHLAMVRDDAEDIARDLKAALREKVPAHQMVDLMDWGQEPYLFKDSMHFTDYGVQQIVKSVTESECYQRISK